MSEAVENATENTAVAEKQEETKAEKFIRPTGCFWTACPKGNGGTKKGLV